MMDDRLHVCNFLDVLYSLYEVCISFSADVVLSSSKWEEKTNIKSEACNSLIIIIITNNNINTLCTL